MKRPKGDTVLVSEGAFGASAGKYTTEAKVEDLLSTQFTAITEDGRTLFLFYSDRDVTWRDN